MTQIIITLENKSWVDKVLATLGMLKGITKAEVMEDNGYDLPNDTTLAAMEEAKHYNGKGFTNVDDLFKSLNED